VAFHSLASKRVAHGIGVSPEAISFGELSIQWQLLVWYFVIPKKKFWLDFATAPVYEK
jgi:hypothetical protein